MTDFTGLPGNDSLTGGADGDNFDISQGGVDTVHGAGGDDVVQAGGTLTADDRIDGGDGNDTVILDGDYSAGLVFGADTLTHVERIELAADHSYDLTLSDQTVATADGAQFSVAIDDLAAGQHLVIDASAFQSGQLESTFTIDAASTVIGGAADDTMVFAGQGRFNVTGGGGDDTVAIYRPMTQADHFHGGDGANDTLVMLTAQTTTLTGAMVDSVETLWVDGGDYNIRMRDTAVAAGHSMFIEGGNLEAGDHLDFNGSRERDGTFAIAGGVEADILAGGRGDDTISALSGDDAITGGKGADTLAGEDGADTFIYRALSDSGHHHQFDLITDLDDSDTIDLSTLDADKGKAGNQAFHLVDAFGGHAGELVMSYDADADLTTLSVDVNGDAKADMAVQIAGDHHDFTHFVL